ncbi:hypothetical protein V501_02600 [Pseudogymnoascus sp. VKM F-4519 (FW-2642)]|nr:hypothetical protein V501_02600 [Pseudogymnoascus sp. VKM F-4519 (FW-2642)]
MAPLFKIPPGESNARVRIIDSTARIGGIPTTFFFTPDSAVEGFTHMPTIPCWVFLIEHSSGKKVLFDLGVRKDWRNLSVGPRIGGYGWDIQVDRDVLEILADEGIAAKDINSIIWSHMHWDHVGDPSLFPSSTELVVGPGFKKAFVPGAPANPASPILETDYKDRELREIDFDQDIGLKAGQLKAFDFFGDGSFYLLDTPGHTIGHLAGLLRTTTNPDTFIMMGGDLCHHGGELRPSPHRPLPAEINPHPWANMRPKLCPGGVLEDLQEKRGRNKDQAFFDVAMGMDIPEAQRTIHKTQEADASDDIFFIFAHEDNVMGVIDTFPKEANNWKEKGWGDQTRWGFLKDFDPAVGNDSRLK